MTKGLLAYLRDKNGHKKAEAIIKRKATENPVFFNIEYNMFIDEYHMTPEQFLSSDKNGN